MKKTLKAEESCMSWAYKINTRIARRGPIKSLFDLISAYEPATFHNQISMQLMNVSITAIDLPTSNSRLLAFGAGGGTRCLLLREASRTNRRFCRACQPQLTGQPSRGRLMRGDSREDGHP